MASEQTRTTYMAVDYELVILPRSSTGVFEYKEKEVANSANERSKSIVKLIRLVDKIPNYFDHTESSVSSIASYKFKTMDYDDKSKKNIVFKEIDFRVYEDLWAEKNYENKTVTKKNISLALVIKKAEAEYLLCPQKEAKAKIYSMCIYADPKSTGKKIWLQLQGTSVSTDKKTGTADNPLRLTEGSFNENSCINLEVCVEDSTGTRSGDGLFEIKVTYLYKTARGGCEGKERDIELPLQLYRNNQTSLEGFKSEGGQKDRDFYVTARVNYTESQKALLKRIQILNNQVLSRNKKLSEFTFVAEDGQYENGLSKNIVNSYVAFKTYTDEERQYPSISPPLKSTSL